MKKVKIIISILAILLISLIGLLFALLYQKNYYENNIQDEDNNTSNVDVEIKKESSINNILNVEMYVKQITKFIRDDNVQALYDITNKEYIAKHNINNSNIEVVYSQFAKGEYYIQEVYYVTNNQSVEYFVKGIVQNDYQTTDTYTKVINDKKNGSYALEPILLDEYSKVKENETISNFTSINIQQNSNNIFSIQEFSEEYIARKIVADYQLKLKYMPELAYEMMNDEYKNAKFGNVEEFKKYVESNKKRIDEFIISGYKIKTEDETTDIYISDINNNRYLFKIQSSLLEYEVILNSYTVESDEYIEKYSKLTNEQKVNECINKFLKLLNEKEYKFAYEYIDEDFKNSNFNTIDKFEEYIKKNLFDNNIGTIKDMKKIGNVYSCRVNIKSSVALSALEKNVIIIIRLNEGTDFTISFSFEE